MEFLNDCTKVQTAMVHREINPYIGQTILIEEVPETDRLYFRVVDFGLVTQVKYGFIGPRTHIRTSCSNLCGVVDRTLCSNLCREVLAWSHLDS